MYAYPAGPSGDDDAFTDLCVRYRPRLVALCRRRLRSTYDAEDAAHEVLLRAHRAMDGFDASADAWPWLRTIALRVCVDIVRRETRAPMPATDGLAVEDVHDQFARRLRVDIVEDALKQLPTRHRTALVLKEYGGWSYDDIARTDGTSRSSVRSLLSRSRRRLGMQVESVARDRGQWPLPGALPPVQRLRGYMRSWRDAVDRSGHAIVAAIEWSSVATRWMVGAPALAGMLTLSGTAAASALVSPPPVSQAPRASSNSQVTVKLPRQEQATVSLPEASITATATTPTPETLTRFSANVIDTEAAELSGNATVSTYEDQIYVSWDEDIALPGRESEGTTGTNVTCTMTVVHAELCNAVRTVAPHVPDPST